MISIRVKISTTRVVFTKISYSLAIVISYICLAFTFYKLLSYMLFCLIIPTLKGSDFSSRRQSGVRNIPGEDWGCLEEERSLCSQSRDCLARVFTSLSLVLPILDL